ncbi:MAG: hypothetical protein JWQ71_878 [Pedosphaera sp.]|nr:hypothetical protein [Pedosphaera sp.]
MNTALGKSKLQSYQNLIKWSKSLALLAAALCFFINIKNIQAGDNKDLVDAIFLTLQTNKKL